MRMKKIRFKKQSRIPDIVERDNLVDDIVKSIYSYGSNGLSVNNVRAEYRRRKGIVKRRDFEEECSVKRRFGHLVAVVFKRLGWKREGKRYYKVTR